MCQIITQCKHCLRAQFLTMYLMVKQKNTHLEVQNIMCKIGPAHPMHLIRALFSFTVMCTFKQTTKCVCGRAILSHLGPPIGIFEHVQMCFVCMFIE